MKNFNWKKFLKDCAQAYFISLGACALVAVLSHWFFGFDRIGRYLEGLVIMLAVLIPMGILIFERFGGNIWVRRLVLWLFSFPMVILLVLFVLDGRGMTVKTGIGTIVGYTCGLCISYFTADILERRKLKQINEKLSRNE